MSIRGMRAERGSVTIVMVAVVVIGVVLSLGAGRLGHGRGARHSSQQ